MKYRNRFDDRHRITEINLPDHGQKSNSAAKIPIFEGPKNARQEAVVKAFQHAWAGYKKYAWGQDELRPISKSYSTWIGAGLTLVDAFDTAIIMGLDQEVRDGAEWIENSLTFDKRSFDESLRDDNSFSGWPSFELSPYWESDFC
ncbi:unnamed protein product, partial [Mesorhabditis belari]|uniref:alpha-1,2-Mannosidase n=1 Tax=Mesorhabditis belari TaxID=2138241 RepID=A0AAF3F7R0_9BILA